MGVLDNLEGIPPEAKKALEKSITFPLGALNVHGGDTNILITIPSPKTGIYRVSALITAHTNNDSPSIDVFFTDEYTGVAMDLTIVNGNLTADDQFGASLSGSLLIYASSVAPIIVKYTLSTQTTTRAYAFIERLDS